MPKQKFRIKLYKIEKETTLGIPAGSLEEAIQVALKMGCDDMVYWEDSEEDVIAMSTK